MDNNTKQAGALTRGVCPTCGVERECRVRFVRWNFVNADAVEGAAIVRIYECEFCGTALNAGDVVLPTNGKQIFRKSTTTV